MKDKPPGSIIAHLSQVAAERDRRAGSPRLQASVQAIKRYQQERFRHTYADLLATQRYGAAAHFFLEELYGPDDFTRRDAQFMRVAPAIVRLFPGELVHAVEILARLHALSELLDSEMAQHVAAPSLDACAYIRAWQATGQPEKRELQISLILEIGGTLDRYTRKPLLRQTLRVMRGPAKSAGLGVLQRFLESGFDAFNRMKGAGDFLGLVGRRERMLASALFGATGLVESTSGHASDKSTEFALSQLP